MFGKDAMSDKELQKQVNRRLQRSGSQAGLNITVQSGTVTVTGKLRAESQRLTIVKALKSVNGVRQVIAQLQSPPKKQHQRDQPPVAKSALTQSEISDGDTASRPILGNQDGSSTVQPTVSDSAARCAE